MTHLLDRVRILAQILFGVLLLFAARGDLWLDEIWSLRMVEQAEHPLELFTRFRHDNNHLLNSLYLYAVGPGRALIVYRLLSVLSGVGTVVLLGKLARKWGPISGLIAVILAGASYPLVLYGSEARGYAPAMFFSLAAFWILDAVLDGRQDQRIPWFWAASILGVLSHFTFVIVLFSLGVWFLVAMGLRRSRLMNTLVKGGQLFAVPLITIIGLYVFYIRGMEIGGGPVYPKWDVAQRAAAMALGFPLDAGYPAVALMCLLILVGAASLCLLKEGSALGVFFPVVIIAAPALMVWVTRPVFLYFRYFLVCVPFLYLLMAGFWSRGIQTERRWISGISCWVLLGILTGHGARVFPLLRTGRGEYRKALTEMAERTPGDEVVIGSDHDFRNKTLIAFYLPYLRTDKSFAYVEASARAKVPPEWFITHTQRKHPEAPPVIDVPEAGRYELTDTYPYAGVSGWHWFVYQRRNR